jgi:hypothetical protein
MSVRSGREAGRGGHHPHVHPPCLASTQRHVLVSLQKAQQLGLRRAGHLADLV